MLSMALKLIQDLIYELPAKNYYDNDNHFSKSQLSPMFCYFLYCFW